MEEQDLQVHFVRHILHELDGQERNTMKASSWHQAQCFTKEIAGLPNKVCVINGDIGITDFDGEIPWEVGKWTNKLPWHSKIQHGFYRLWGDSASRYAFGLTFEIPNCHSAVKDMAYTMKYAQQVAAIGEVAREIADEIPCAQVRLEERNAFEERHSLSVYFIYPCEMEAIYIAERVLAEDFAYVKDIGNHSV